MSRNEDVDNAIWSDPKFEVLSPQAKLLYIWSWTNPRCGMAGVYEVGKTPMSRETGLKPQAVDAALGELVESGRVVYSGHLLWVRARVKRLRTRTSQIARSIANDIGKVDEDSPIRLEFMDAYAGVPWLREQLAIIEPPTGWPSAHVSNATRKAVLERDGFSCRQCGSDERLTVDHRKPRSQGGSGDETNLQVLCVSCNTRKGPNSDLAPTLGKSEVPMEPPMEVPLSGSGSGLRSTTSDKGVARELFEYWRERCNHPSALFTAERRSKVEGRLREDGRTPDDIRQGINGAAIAPFISPEGKRYDDLELICRSGSKLEDFMGRATDQPGSTLKATDTAAINRLLGVAS